MNGNLQTRYGLRTAVSLFCLLAGFCVSSAQTHSSRPNIIVIVGDDLRGDALGVTGHPFFKSPNLDRIANEGVLFQNSFVVHSLCSPSRATLLTGLYSHQHRVLDNDTPLHSRLTTVAQYLNAAGYATAFIGKWHMGFLNAAPKPGFERWVSFIGQGKYLDPLLNVDGERIQTNGHMTDILTNYALDFLGRDRQKPFFLVLSHKAAHDPFTVQPRFYRIYENANIILPPTHDEDLSSKPAFLQDYSGFFKQDLRLRIQQYYECLAGVDESVEKILAALTQRNLLDNTLIIFTGDNGYLLGEHNVGDKRLAYEESMRVPLLARYPKWFAAGTRRETFALNIDLAPTLLEAAGISPPVPMPGISLRKLARGEAKRNCFLYEYSADTAVAAIPPIRAIRTHDFKYIKYFDSTTTEELYDMRKDPVEANNLIDQPEFASVLRRLRFQLDSLRLAAHDTLASDISAPTNSRPADFVLYQNYPNPFSSNGAFGTTLTTIRYALYKAGPVRVEVFDIAGRKVATLVNARQEPGFRTIPWNASRFAGGVYLCRLQAGAFVQTKKMIILK
jgi:N-acetylglucosamine-6-sulfatase